MATKEEIARKAVALVTDIQAWSESQAELWRQLPELTRQLYWDGRTYSKKCDLHSPIHDFRLCTSERLWTVREEEGGRARLYVDTESGKLHADPEVHRAYRRMSAQSDRALFLQAPDPADILWLSGRLNLADVALIIEDLKRQIKEVEDRHDRLVELGMLKPTT